MRPIAAIVFFVALCLPATARAADFTFGVTTVSGSFVYTVGSQTNPTLNLVRGHTYTLQVNTPGHPFWIKTAAVTGTGSTFDTGVTNNGIDSGVVTFTVQPSAPSSLFYQCGLHSSMSGSLQISGPAVPAINALATIGLLLLLGGAGLALRRSRAATA